MPSVRCFAFTYFFHSRCVSASCDQSGVAPPPTARHPHHGVAIPPLKTGRQSGGRAVGVWWGGWRRKVSVECGRGRGGGARRSATPPRARAALLTGAPARPIGHRARPPPTPAASCPPGGQCNGVGGRGCRDRPPPFRAGGASAAVCRRSTARGDALCFFVPAPCDWPATGAPGRPLWAVAPPRPSSGGRTLPCAERGGVEGARDPAAWGPGAPSPVGDETPQPPLCRLPPPSFNLLTPPSHPPHPTQSRQPLPVFLPSSFTTMSAYVNASLSLLGLCAVS